MVIRCHKSKLLLIRGIQIPTAETIGDDVLGPWDGMCADLEVITGCVKPEFAQASLCETNSRFPGIESEFCTFIISEY